jgi:hypothetical protein
MGCAWNSDTCTNAAQRGHLLVLKWARSKGCPWAREPAPMPQQHAN